MRRNRYPRLAPAALALAIACTGTLARAADAPVAASMQAAAPATAAAPAAAVPSGPTPPEVQQALDYSVPESPCRVPKMERGNSSGAFDRFEHQVAMYKKCVPEYQQTLTNDFQMLQAAAKKGPAKDQEAIIVGKAQKILGTIQSLRAASAAQAH